MTNTTPLDFAKCEARARKMSKPALQWSINDCKEAIAAMPDGHKAGYYMDEIHVYAAELKRRTNYDTP